MAEELKELLIGWQEISGFTGVSLSTLKTWRDKLDFPIQHVPVPGKDKQAVATTKTAINEWLTVTFNRTGGEYRHNTGLV